jgi:hypothetical protein
MTNTTTYTTRWDIPNDQLVELAVEYSMLSAKSHFQYLSERAKDAMLRTIGKVADEIDWTGCFEAI